MGEVGQPAIISVPVAFLTIYVVSKMTAKNQSEETWAQLHKSFHALHNPDSDKPVEGESA